MSRGWAVASFIIMGLLLGVTALPTFIRIVLRSDEIRSRGEQARRRVTKAVITTVSQQIDLFKLDHERYPETLEDLTTAPSYVRLEKFPAGGYLKEYPKDGWGRRLIYRRGPGKPYQLISYGADGREGGEGTDADIFE